MFCDLIYVINICVSKNIDFDKKILKHLLAYVFYLVWIFFMLIGSIQFAVDGHIYPALVHCISITSNDEIHVYPYTDGDVRVTAALQYTLEAMYTLTFTASDYFLTSTSPDVLVTILSEHFIFTLVCYKTNFCCVFKQFTLVPVICL